MSRLDELIQEYCPDGVTFKPLWSVTIWDKKFNAVDRNKQPRVCNYPYLLAKDLFALEVEGGDVFLLSTGEQTGWTTQELAGDNLREGEVVTIPWGKSRAVTDCIKYYKGKFVTADNRIMTSNDTSVLSNKYLYYWIMTQGEIIDSFYRGSGIKHPDMAKVLDMRIPVPPLPVQEEIVRILDTFTSLTAELQTELQAELQARKKQFEYYRNVLLNMPDAPKVSLAEVTLKVESINWRSCSESKQYIDLSSVSRDTHKILHEDVITVNAASAPSRAKQLIKAGDILFGGTRPMLKRFCIVTSEYDGDVASTGYCVLRVDENMISRNYLYHCLGTSSFYAYVEANQQGASYPAIGDAVLKKYEISLPDLGEQKRVSDILDRFETLCNDISSGLPAEIEARQKQYEYYRDKLLTFKQLT